MSPRKPAPALTVPRYDPLGFFLIDEYLPYG